MDSAYLQPPVMWVRDGERFRIEESSGLGGPRRDRTAVVADLDRDGDLDIVAGELNGPLRLYVNTTDDGMGLLVRPEDPVGTRVEVVVRGPDGATKVMRRWIRGGGPFQSTAAPEAHVGIPPGHLPESVLVTWPGGHTQRVDAPEERIITVPRPGSEQR